MSQLLIVGLGNPGTKYSKTRHNVGQMAIELLPDLNQLTWKKAFFGQQTSFSQNQKKIHILFPETYMNNSGKSVRALCDFYKVLPKEVLIVHDELDFELGNLAFKLDGGTAGHNGLKSVAEYLGTKKFYRLRLGIGRPDGEMSVSDWVLSTFYKKDQKKLDDMLFTAQRAIECFYEQGPQKAFLEFNTGKKGKT